jgi:hypothetical protein
VIDTTVRRAGELLVVGTVRGLVGEVAPLVQRLTAFGPGAMAVGISFDELTGLTDHFLGGPSEPVVPLTASETAEAKAVSRFGEVRVPNPSVLAALEWATSRSVLIEAVDPSDETYATMFTDHITYFELVRRTLRERKLTRTPPKASTPDELARAWHSTLTPGKGSREFNAAREAAICEATERLVERIPRVALLVDRERFDPVVARLRRSA